MNALHVKLEIAGQGVVAPSLSPVELPSLRDPARTWPVLRVDLKAPQFVALQQEPRLRRAGPLALFMVEAARQALADQPGLDPGRLGIVAAFWTGGIIYSRRFYQEILKSGPRFASPNLFPETVFNVSVSHLASVLGAKGFCYSLVGDEGIVATALRTAQCWLAGGQVDAVLIVGAEELDPVAVEAYADCGWLKPGRPFRPSEGAAALLLRRSEEGRGDSLRIEMIDEGRAYHSRKDACALAKELIQKTEGPVYFGAAQGNWLAPVERASVPADRRVSGEKAAYGGEAFTASALWHVQRAGALAGGNETKILVPCWGHNSQVSTLQLGRHSH